MLFCWFISPTLLHNAMRKFETFFSGHPVYKELTAHMRSCDLKSHMLPILSAETATSEWKLNVEAVTKTLHEKKWNTQQIMQIKTKTSLCQLWNYIWRDLPVQCNQVHLHRQYQLLALSSVCCHSASHDCSFPWYADPIYIRLSVPFRTVVYIHQNTQHTPTLSALDPFKMDKCTPYLETIY